MRNHTPSFLAAAFAVVLLSIPASAQVPNLLNYQGRVAVGTVNFDGSGQFKFALVDTTGATTYWSNDGTSSAGSQPTNAVTLTVTKGLYSVLLGDATLSNMTAVPASVFAHSDVRLRVWFNDGANGFQQLAPDQRIAAVGYAMVAAGVPDGAITATKIANGAIGSSQLAPNVTLGGNFTVSGDINLPATSGSAAGGIFQNGTSLIQTFGTENFFAGTGAGNFTLSGFYNTGVGNASLQSNTAGQGNTAIGDDALMQNTTGNFNTAAGSSALYSNTTGDRNTAIGNSALGFNVSGVSNTAAGWTALSSNSTGGANTAVGVSALTQNSSGSNNTAVGAGALGSNTTGSNLTAFGSVALFSNTSGSTNTAFGASALQNNNAGSGNIAMGFQSLLSNTSGNLNAADGVNALEKNTTGSANTAGGANALQNNTTSGQNVAIGQGALTTQSFSNGGTAWNSNNVAVGCNALTANQPVSNVTGVYNTAVGTSALQSNTTGFSNTATGLGAMQSNTTGHDNTAIGTNALQSNLTGVLNIAVGGGAGINLTGNNNIDIGNAGVESDSAVMRLGSAQTSTFVAGIRGVTTGSNNSQTVLIDANGQMGTISSSRRYKEDIADMGDASVRLQSLRPVTFRYRKPYANGEKPIQFGLIAEEVAEVFPELAVYNAEGQPESVKYQDLAPLLLNEVQKLAAEKDKLKKELAETNARLSRLESLLSPAPAAAATEGN